MCRQKHEMVVKSVDNLANKLSNLQKDVYGQINVIRSENSSFMKRSTFFQIIGGGLSVIIPAIFIALNYMNSKLEDRINEHKKQTTSSLYEIKSEIKEMRRDVQSIALSVGKIQVKFENSIIE